MKVELTKMGNCLYIVKVYSATKVYRDGIKVYIKKDINGILKEAKLSWNKLIDYIPLTVDLPKKTLEKYHIYFKS